MIKHISFLFILLFPMEAYMSQVHYEEFNHSIETSTARATLIVSVKDLKKIETYKKIVFPKETHYKKSEETTYSEIVKLYQVEEVVKSTDKIKLKKGDEIKVWQNPAYGEYAMQAYHEQGISKSPIVESFKNNFPVKDDKLILFLSPYKDVYQELGGSTGEGLGALDKIKKEIKNPSKSNDVLEAYPIEEN